MSTFTDAAVAALQTERQALRQTARDAMLAMLGKKPDGTAWTLTDLGLALGPSDFANRVFIWADPDGVGLAVSPRDGSGWAVRVVKRNADGSFSRLRDRPVSSLAEVGEALAGVA